MRLVQEVAQLAHRVVVRLAGEPLSELGQIVEAVSASELSLGRSGTIDGFQPLVVGELVTRRTCDTRRVLQQFVQLVSCRRIDLLRLLLENTNLVVTRETILQVVWGTDISVESRTVDMHIRTLRKKLGDAGKYICTVRKVGYKLTDEEEAGEE
mgnify:CR=1 FL=1